MELDKAQGNRYSVRLKLNIIIILGAIYFVHFANGYSGTPKGAGYEYPLMILVVNILIAATGAGKYSIDAMRAKKDGQSM